MIEMNFPEPLKQALVQIEVASPEYDDLYFFSAEEHMWSNTSMGIGSGFSGQAFTGGWIVTLKYSRRTEVWHVSKYGYTALASIEEE